MAPAIFTAKRAQTLRPVLTIARAAAGLGHGIDGGKNLRVAEQLIFKDRPIAMGFLRAVSFQDQLRRRWRDGLGAAGEIEGAGFFGQLNRPGHGSSLRHRLQIFKPGDTQWPEQLATSSATYRKEIGPTMLLGRPVKALAQGFFLRGPPTGQVIGVADTGP